MCIVKCFQFCILTVNCQCILCQVIRSDTKKINFFCQLITNHNCRRSFNHDALLRCVVFNTLPV